jgi:serine/threonine protein kinase
MCSIYYNLDGSFERHFVVHPTNNKHFFRKYIDKRKYEDRTEYKICQILQKNPHQNIVNIYEVTKDYIDMEILHHLKDTDNINYDDIYHALDHLHKLNIVYFDILTRNMGISYETHHIKLFDFNCAGILVNPTKWARKPIERGIAYEYVSNMKVKNFIHYDYILINKLIDDEKYRNKKWYTCLLRLLC